MQISNRPTTQLPAAGVFLNDLSAIASGSSGNLYFTAGNSVFRVDRRGMLARIAGSQEAPGFSGDPGPATSAQLNNPGSLAVDAAGNVYVNDTNNKRIGKIAPGLLNAGESYPPIWIARQTTIQVAVTDGGAASASASFLANVSGTTAMHSPVGQ